MHREIQLLLGEFVPMHSSCQATVCLLSQDDDYQQSFEELLEKVMEHPPHGRWELRLGFQRAIHSFHYALGLL